MQLVVQAACKAHKIHCDHQVTINFVGVLRPVMTHHVKTGNTGRVMGELRGPYSWWTFPDWHAVNRLAFCKLHDRPLNYAQRPWRRIRRS
jgi:hypothetical protein